MPHIINVVPDGSGALHNARDAVRAYRADHPNTPIEVRLAGGTYRLDRTLTLGVDDAGRPDPPITWRAAAGEAVTISGGHPVESWRRLDHDVPGLPDGAADHIWYVDLAGTDDEGRRLRTLYDGMGMLPRAATGPHFTPEDKLEHATPSDLYFASGDLKNYDNLDDVELFLIPRFTWLAQYFSLESVDEAAGHAVTKFPCTNKLMCRGCVQGWEPEKHFRVENVAEGMTGPGRWMVNTHASRLYLWPRDGEPTGVVVPRLTELIRVEGQDDGTRPAGDLRFEGLTFTHADRPVWPKNRRAAQHDWELYDWDSAMLRVRDADRVDVKGCRFQDAGAGGVRIDARAVGCQVERCTFRDLGHHGVSIMGHEPGRREDNHHHHVRRNTFVRCGRLYWQSSAVFINQSGWNTVADNHIEQMPYSGIVLVSGREGAFGDRYKNDGTNGRVVADDAFGDSPRELIRLLGHLTCRHNVIEHNDISHVMQELGDGNGIYLSGTGWGNLVRGNYVHDIMAMGCDSGIRCDDHQWFTRIEGNVVWKMRGGGIKIKGVNDVTNNIVGHCDRAGVLVAQAIPAWGASMRRNILVQDGIQVPGAIPPFFDAGGRNADMRSPHLDSNVLHSPNDPAVAQQALEQARGEYRHEVHGIAGDPGFVDLEHRDFHLHPDAAAIRQGFQPLIQWGVRPE